MAPTWRERLDDGQLDIRVVDASHPFCRTRLVAAAADRDLAPQPGVRDLADHRPASDPTTEPLRLARDGETFDGADDFEIGKNGQRLAVFTPRRNSLAAGRAGAGPRRRPRGRHRVDGRW